MKSIIFNIFKDQPIGVALQKQFPIATGNVILHTFPDNESLLQIKTEIQDQDILLVASLNQPNEKIFPMILFANAARDLGAKSIGLVAPYLAYMRQDISFHPGEAISAKYFARLLSHNFDWLLTVDPHLHRFHDLQEIYTVPTKILAAAPSIAEWIKANVKKPLLIGPDIESSQWVSSIATIVQAPFVISEKMRIGDRKVEVKIPNLDKYSNHTPVLVDDIISTGQTMIDTLKHLQSSNLFPPICIGVHALFADNAFEELKLAGANQIITCNSVQHISNQIDLTPYILANL